MTATDLHLGSDRQQTDRGGRTVVDKLRFFRVPGKDDRLRSAGWQNRDGLAIDSLNGPRHFMRHSRRNRNNTSGAAEHKNNDPNTYYTSKFHLLEKYIIARGQEKLEAVTETAKYIVIRSAVRQAEE
jgi:hypothetical protein